MYETHTGSQYSTVLPSGSALAPGWVIHRAEVRSTLGYCGPVGAVHTRFQGFQESYRGSHGSVRHRPGIGGVQNATRNVFMWHAVGLSPYYFQLRIGNLYICPQWIIGNYLGFCVKIATFCVFLNLFLISL